MKRINETNLDEPIEKKKDKKLFKIGDVIVCINTKRGNLPLDCHEFLLTYKKFKVIDISDKLNIDLGYRLAENGNPIFFNSNRFELEKIKPEPKIKPLSEMFHFYPWNSSSI